MITARFEGLSKTVAKVRRVIEEAGPDSKSIRAAFHKVGMAVQREAIMNATRQGIVDTGSLRAHIGYEFFRDGATSGVRVGVFGVKYAALHEFGGPFTDRMRRAMFASLRRRGKLAPGSRNRHSKGVIVGGYFRARPYLLPAFRGQKAYVVEMIRQAIKEALKEGG